MIILLTNFFPASAKTLKDLALEDKNARWEITANKMSYNEKQGIYIAEGDVLITRGSQVLSAQKAKYNEKAGIVEVSGDIRLDVNGDILSGVSGIFDLNNQTGQITKGRLFLQENHYYLDGDVLEKVGPDSYKIKDFRLTTCDGERPAWSITGSEVEVTIEGYGTVKHAAFRIYDFPVFYLPRAIFPAKTKRQTGLLPPKLGYSDRNGAVVEVPFFWAISDQADATFYERYMSKRGFMQGLEFRYLTANKSKGTFLFDILSDKVEKKDLNDPDDLELSPFPRTNQTRYWLRSRTDQQFPVGIRARLDTDFVSDQDYLHEFQGGGYGFDVRPNLAKESGRPTEEIYSPTRRSALRLSRDGQEYSLQALASYFQRPENPPNDPTPQPLAGVGFSVLPRPVPHIPLFLKFDTDYNYVWRDVGLKGHRMSFTPELSYPVWIGRYLEFEPSVSFTHDTQWLDNHENIDRQSKDAYQMQAVLSTVIERTFDFEWKDVKKLKHKVLPSLAYNFRDHKDQDRFKPWFEPMDVEGKTNRITLSVDNLMDVRKEDDKGWITYAQWGTFGLSQGYDIDEAGRDERPWQKKEPFEPLVGTLSLMPFPNLDLDVETHWDHYDNDISFADLSLELSIDRSGGRKDSYEIDYQYTEEGNENINYRLDINLLYGFSAGTSLKRDLNIGHNLGSSYWLEYQSQCWGVRLITAKLEGIESVMVSFRLLGFGD